MVKFGLCPRLFSFLSRAVSLHGGTFSSIDSCRPLDAGHLLPHPFREVTTPLPWQVWGHKLARHPDQRFRNYIVSGLRHGVRIGFDYSPTCCKAKHNLLSASDQPHIVRDYLADECSAGRVLGPLPPNVRVSPFGVILKKSSQEMEVHSRPLGAIQP